MNSSSYGPCLIVFLLFLSLGFAGCKGKESPPPPPSASPSPEREAVATPEPADDSGEEAEEESTEFEIDGDADQYFGQVPLTVEFFLTEKNAQGPVKYEWDFGDGSPRAAGKSQKHIYEKPGTYIAKVMATDAAGAFDHINFLLTALGKEQWEEFQKKSEAGPSRASAQPTPAASPGGSSG